MAKATKTDTQEIHQLVTPGPTLIEVDNGPLTEADVKLLTRREVVKAELKKLDRQLKPKIAATIEQCGTGVVQIGNKRVELKEHDRNCVAWKPLVYSIIEEEAINEVLGSFTEVSKIRSAKVVR